MNIPAGAIVGIIGPNGAGKSTLFKLIAGREQADSGEVIVGQTVKMAYVEQTRDALANDKTAWEDISGGLDIINVGKFQMASRAYAGRFNFNGQDQQKKVGNLSGGERGRLHLAKTLIQGGNVLLLDEPSNDLDVETLRALEDALLEYAGTVLVISHDRWFLDRIATHILAAEGDSQWVYFDGQDVRGDTVEEPAIVGDHQHRARVLQQRIFQRAQGFHVQVVGRLVQQQHVAALDQRLGQVQAAALAAGEVADLLLLVLAVEVEAARVGTRSHLELADVDDVQPARDVFPRRLVVGQRVTRLFHIGHLDRLAHDDFAGVGLLAPRDQLEQRGLAGTVGADDADDGASGDVHGQVVDEHAVAKALGDVVELDRKSTR